MTSCERMADGRQAQILLRVMFTIIELLSEPLIVQVCGSKRMSHADVTYQGEFAQLPGLCAGAGAS